MKNLVVFFGIVLSSITAMAGGELLPVGHTWCINADVDDVVKTCDQGKQFYTASDGRCGCLAKSEIIPPKTCMVAFIKCDDSAPFAGVYQRSAANGEQKWKGCGCFGTADGMHATSVR